MSASHALPVIDIDELDALTDGSRELLEVMHNAWLEDRAIILRRLDESLAAQNIDELGKVVHRLKGTLSAFAAARGLARIRAVEVACERADISAIRREVTTLRNDLDDFECALAARLAER